MTANTKKNKQKTAYNNNFLEALRDLGGGFVKSAGQDLGGGIVRDALGQLSGRPASGDLKPDEDISLDQIKDNNREKAASQSREFYQDYLDIRRQEKLVYSRIEQETKLQIAAILEELKKIALSTKNLAKEVEVAVAQSPVDPGSYHLGFFEKLRETLILMRRRLDDSASWLAAFNQRSKRRNYYWGQFQKSGSKFLLSQERYMSTQAG